MAKKKKKKVQEEIIEETNEEIKEDTEQIEENTENNVDDEVIVEEVKDDEMFDKKTIKKTNNKKHIFTDFIIIITMLSSLGYFFINITDKNSTFNSLINCSILVLFTIIYLVVCLTTKRKSKATILLSSLLLLGFYIYNLNNMLNIVKSPTNSIEDFRGKNLTDVVKWANGNNINVIQDFEYSDMVDEFSIITQDVKPGTNLKDIDSITVSVSEGPNPSKEIIVPSMITWDDQRVINYVKNNYLNNVNVEFVESDKKKDTVIEQNKSGNLKRNDELKLTFSYGDEGNSEEVKLIDFTKKSKFEIEFYMRQHHLKYKFEYDFSDKIKKGLGISQSIKAGETVRVDDKEIIVTLSKGPKIKVPDFKNMSTTKLTEWAVKNKVKLEFTDKYDDSVKEGNVISCDKEAGDVIDQGSTIKVTVSRGKLKMPGFKNVDDFYEWADKYEIKYEIKREFSDSVKPGEVISYSVKKGQTIKTDEAIIVTISDGKNCKVPDLKGLSKSDAISKLKKANLEYNFVYKNSDKAKDKVISQSISSGSEISCGTSITVTLSNGKKEETKVEKRKEDNSSNNNNNNNNNSNNNSNNNNNSGNNNGSNNNPEPPKPTQTCNECNIRSSQIFSIIEQYSSCSAAASALRSSLQSKCSGLTVNVSCQNKDGYDPADFVSGFDGGPVSSCDSISIVLAN